MATTSDAILKLDVLPNTGLRLYESAEVEHFAPFATLAPMWNPQSHHHSEKWALYRFDGAIDFFPSDDAVRAYVARNNFVARAR